jgi:hypothetical protein
MGVQQLRQFGYIVREAGTGASMLDMKNANKIIPVQNKGMSRAGRFFIELKGTFAACHLSKTTITWRPQPRTH